MSSEPVGIPLSEILSDHRLVFYSFYHLLAPQALSLSTIVINEKSYEFAFGSKEAVDCILDFAKKPFTTTVSKYDNIRYSIHNAHDAQRLLKEYLKSALLLGLPASPSAASGTSPAETEVGAYQFGVKAFSLYLDIRDAKAFTDRTEANLFYMHGQSSKLSQDKLNALVRRMFSNRSAAIVKKTGRRINAHCDLFTDVNKFTCIDDFMMNLPESFDVHSMSNSSRLMSNNKFSSATGVDTELVKAHSLSPGPTFTMQSMDTGQDAVFSGRFLVDWLLRNTSIMNRDAAQDLAVLCVKTGLVKSFRRESATDMSNMFEVDHSGLIFKIGPASEALLHPGSTSVEPMAGRRSSALSSTRRESTAAHDKSQGSLVAITEQKNENSELNLAAAGTDTNKESPVNKLREILKDPDLLELFIRFMQKQYSEENILFWMDTQRFRQMFRNEKESNADQILKEITRLYEDYLPSSSPHELNIDSRLRKEIQGRYVLAIKYKPSGTTEENAESLKHIRYNFFDTITKAVFQMMATESALKFLRWEEYVAYKNPQADVVEKPIQKTATTADEIQRVESRQIKEPKGFISSIRHAMRSMGGKGNKTMNTTASATIPE